ncbi:hypothetical protein TVAG_088630 [Trichomonas vaginalis G3]|uniref:Uncharacterized protein n=1 Tax=Trichomonas vaginalis (strain ATCC PRA-98 / G3) TaxID=412133 RepID=A2EB08_TRIV3|nr:protein ubiquitination [Trichomonas vaginalis G3]EAY10148.1 hypothetical protein TVAG_088630 [Trichomonas vaginalis G3]KAI5534477.1 protein ubiquitination [Trichomonas vaginalis G3]|eukprot:XP_001322371.1 hypothetical protein [Trichomonas vaginalis G3]
MTIDYKYYADRIDEWINDRTFYDLRTTDQICCILDNTSLGINYFFEIVKNVHEFFTSDDMFKILQHVHIDFGSEFSNITKVLEFLSKVLNFQFLSDIKAFIQINHDSFTPPQKNIQNKITNNNTIMLRSLRKAEQNHLKIYEILENAAAQGDEQTIKVSVDENYSEVRQPEFGYNMILQAAQKGNFNLVKLLCKHGADALVRGNFSSTILHNFCSCGCLEGVKYAIVFIDVNDLDNYDNTPLHIAAIWNKPEICEFLCKQPTIKKNAKNQGNKTPLGEAIKRYNNQAIDVLRKYGCTEF